MLHIIVNPAAGNGRTRRVWRKLKAGLSNRGFCYEVCLTEKRGDATALARAYAESDARTIVAVGGDGTVHEVVNGLIRDDAAVNPNTRLAVVPGGTGKDMARTLGIHTLADTLRALETDRVAAIDVGAMVFDAMTGGEQVSRYFVNVADLGLGADVARRVGEQSTWKAFGGKPAYFVQAVKAICVIEGKEVTITCDDTQAYTGRAQMIVFCNGRYFAGGMHVAPAASLRDGLLDVFVLEDVSRMQLMLSLLPRVYFGKHIGCKGVHHLKARTIRVAGSDSFNLEIDGELPGKSPVETRVLPKALNVLVPDTIF